MDEKFDRDDEDLLTEDVKNRSTGMPPALRDDEPGAHGGNSVADEEPGPYDDDGLPENAKRRVPS